MASSSGRSVRARGIAALVFAVFGLDGAVAQPVPGSGSVERPRPRRPRRLVRRLAHDLPDHRRQPRRPRPVLLPLEPGEETASLSSRPHGPTEPGPRSTPDHLPGALTTSSWPGGQEALGRSELVEPREVPSPAPTKPWAGHPAAESDEGIPPSPPNPLRKKKGQKSERLYTIGRPNRESDFKPNNFRSGDAGMAEPGGSYCRARGRGLVEEGDRVEAPAAACVP